MNYTDNATDKTMSKLVESNRENNEGYFPKMPKHINDLFVYENRGKMSFPGLIFFANTGWEGNTASQVAVFCKQDASVCPGKNQASNIL